MIEDTNKFSTSTPPYLSVSKMQKLFDLLSSRSFSTLELSDLTNRDFSKSEAFQAFQGLRFLGFLEENGNLTNTQILSLKGDARTNGLKEIVEKAYKKLFARTKNPTSLSRDELHNEFIAEYQLSSRLVRSALPLFLWLCQEAGFEVVKNISPRFREKKGKVRTEKTTQKNKGFFKDNKMLAKEKDLVFPEMHDYNISGIRLLIPKNQETDLLIAEGGLIEITKEIKKFAQEAGLVSSKKDDEEKAGEVA